MNAFDAVGKFFTNCWNAYMEFLGGLVGHDVAIVITIALGMVVAYLIYSLVINWFTH